MERISILGVGRLGGALAIGFSRAGLDVANLIVRKGGDVSGLIPSLNPAPRVVVLEEIDALDTDTLIVAVPDPLIERVAEALEGKLCRVTAVLHTSGSLSSEVLAGLRAAGHNVGSLHPLISFSDPVLGAERLSGGYFCIEGDAAAVAAAEGMVSAVSGHSFTIDTDKKALYHASAVMACGHVVALLDIAFEMLSNCGISKEKARTVLLPLVKSTVMNLEMQTPQHALTGPFARADAENLERNLASIEEYSTESARSLYVELGERSLLLAEQHGVDPKQIAVLRERLKLAKQSRR